MTRGPAGLADWPQSLGPGARRREALAWTGAALTVALVATATAALAMRLDDQLGREAESESVVYLDLTPEPPPPSAAALPDFAPETPMTELPDAPEPEEMAEPEPEVAPPPPDIRPQTDMAQLPDMALPPDSFSPEPPPPAPEPEPEPEVEPEPEQAQIPDVRPRPRPERKPEPERKPREEPVKRAAAPTPRAASPASSTQSQGQAALPQGRLDDLAARWGNQIRSKIQRYTRAPRGKRGSIVVRLEVARSGALMSAGIVRSSGDPSLDAAVVKAVQSARSFAAAPAQLPGASHSFSLPIDFQ